MRSPSRGRATPRTEGSCAIRWPTCSCATPARGFADGTIDPTRRSAPLSARGRRSPTSAAPTRWRRRRPNASGATTAPRSCGGCEERRRRRERPRRVGGDSLGSVARRAGATAPPTRCVFDACPRNTARPDGAFSAAFPAFLAHRSDARSSRCRARGRQGRARRLFLRASAARAPVGIFGARFKQNSSTPTRAPRFIGAYRAAVAMSARESASRQAFYGASRARARARGAPSEAWRRRKSARLRPARRGL